MKKHGMKHTRIYQIWCGIKKRCYNENSKNFPQYGEKGVAVCEEWKNDFLSFYDWCIENGYNENLTIDRIDVKGNYEPSNCRWITHAEQQRNRTNNIYLEYNGETKTLSEWCVVMGQPYKRIYCRMKSALYHYGKFDFNDLFYPQKTKRIYTERFYNRKHYTKKIEQYSKDGKLLKVWDSIKETENYGFNKNAIVSCCKGRSKTSGGYIWKYAEG